MQALVLRLGDMRALAVALVALVSLIAFASTLTATSVLHKAVARCHSQALFAAMAALSGIGTIVSVAIISAYLVFKRKTARMGNVEMRSIDDSQENIPLSIDSNGPTTINRNYDVFTRAKCKGYCCWAIVVIIFAFMTVLAAVMMQLSTAVTSAGPISGRFTFPDLIAPVEVQTEENNMVHIRASNEADLYYMLGWVQAKYRLAQLDVQRRVGSGRLSALVGDAGKPIDKLFRSLGWATKASTWVQNLSDRDKQIFKSFTAGINAWRVQAIQTGNLPPDYALLGSTPELFKEEDVFFSAALIAYDLSKNYKEELARWQLLTEHGLSPERIAQLYPEQQYSAAVNFVTEGDVRREGLEKSQGTPMQVDNVKWLESWQGRFRASNKRAGKKLSETLKAGIPWGSFEDILSDEPHESNNWVIGPQHTVSGKPLLSNDPHIRFGAPGVWFAVHLVDDSSEQAINVTGVTFPGVPAVMSGRNRNIAWGVTNTGADVQDLFVLEANSDKTKIKRLGFWESLSRRDEVIEVKGGKSEKFTVYDSFYGPTINHVFDLPKESPLIALKYNALQFDHEPAVGAFLKVNRASNWNEFVAATTEYVAPSQNFVFASNTGDIGILIPGKIPIRKSNHSGRYPVPGDGYNDWEGYIPATELPTFLNPERGFVATANQQSMPNNYKYRIAYRWAENYRSTRIVDLIKQGSSSGNKIDIKYMQTMQNDTYSLMFQDFKPLIAMLAQQSHDEEAKKWFQYLLEWKDGDAATGSTHATVFQMFIAEYSRLPANEVGDDYWLQTSYLLASLRNSLEANTQDAACISRGMSCAQFAEESMKKAIQRLESSGCKAGTCKWGEDIHKSEFNSIYHTSPVACTADLSVSRGGDKHTVNVGAADPTYDTLPCGWGPSWRSIYNMDDSADAGRMIFPPGQDGNFLSSAYDDWMPVWARGDNFVARMSAWNAKSKATFKPGK